ncbi:lectin [Gyrodon lividus]|nr:lectin [Gyrodon lividus]
MAQVVNVRIFQQNPARGFFDIIERTCWDFANGGAWTRAGGVHTLTMGGSGTSGTLRFRSDTTGEFFVVAVGVHNGNFWCDIVPNLAAARTGVVINGEYYEAGPLAVNREAQLGQKAVVTALGTIVAVVPNAAGPLNVNVVIA